VVVRKDVADFFVHVPLSARNVSLPRVPSLARMLSTLGVHIFDGLVIHSIRSVENRGVEVQPMAHADLKTGVHDRAAVLELPRHVWQNRVTRSIRFLYGFLPHSRQRGVLKSRRAKTKSFCVEVVFARLARYVDPRHPALNVAGNMQKGR
jgi:hypothetical protein